MSQYPNQQISALLRVSRLPLVYSAAQSMTSLYSGAKVRYPLLGLMGGVAEGGVRSISDMAMKQATPLLQSLEPQIEVANSLALIGLDRLERNFPILNQSTEKVIGHLKDALFLTLDDLHLWLVDGVDGVLDQLEHVADALRVTVGLLQDSQISRITVSGLDDIMSRLEEATAYYLPLPPTLRRQWELRVQEYEDEDEDEEPGLWTRVRCLLLGLSLQLHHRMMKLKDQLLIAVKTLEDTSEKMGLLRVLELVEGLLSNLQNLMVTLVYQTEQLREGSLNGIGNFAATLVELGPVRQIQELPVQIQQMLRDLQDLSKILLQLVVNVTPLYNMLHQPTYQEVEDFLNQDDYSNESRSRRSSANSLFLKAMDGRPRRRRSLYSRSGGLPDTPKGRGFSVKDMEAEENPNPSDVGSDVSRRRSATELLLTPLKQFVSQSQKAFEYLSPDTATTSAN